MKKTLLYSLITIFLASIFVTCKKQDLEPEKEDFPISVSITVENETSHEATIR